MQHKEVLMCSQPSFIVRFLNIRYNLKHNFALCLVLFFCKANANSIWPSCNSFSLSASVETNYPSRG